MCTLLGFLGLYKDNDLFGVVLMCITTMSALLADKVIAFVDEDFLLFLP